MTRQALTTSPGGDVLAILCEDRRGCPGVFTVKAEPLFSRHPTILHEQRGCDMRWHVGSLEQRQHDLSLMLRCILQPVEALRAELGGVICGNGAQHRRRNPRAWTRSCEGLLA